MHKNCYNEVHKSRTLCKRVNEDACPRVTVVTVQTPASLHSFTARTACDCKLLLLCCSASRSNYLKKKKKINCALFPPVRQHREQCVGQLTESFVVQ